MRKYDAQGAAWLDFLVTLRGRYRDDQTDALASPADLADFLATYGLRPSRRPTTVDLEAARDLREAMHAVTRSTYAGEPCAGADLRRLAEALADDEPVTVATRRGALRPAAPRDTSAALARLAREQVADLSGPRRALLRPCGDSSCSAFFLDVTGRRQWCSSTRCGSRVRVRRHRARQH